CYSMPEPYFMRYFFHIEHDEAMSVDREGTEFATQLEADDYGARIASEIGMDDGDYTNSVVLVVDAKRQVVTRHPVYRRLSS
ncbi:hypothetical protein, partial [Bradyrhizobium sp. Leo170]|uniref:DUF6894 family protein n=1 Tax=Bradyrhizobium sp. Leo170 TaxID=1571199 RepID=UPI001A92EF71